MNASEMGRKRWKGITHKERSLLMQALNRRRNRKLSAKRRSQIARQAAIARHERK